jgi:DNA-binding NtrC family response regulator
MSDDLQDKDLGGSREATAPAESSGRADNVGRAEAPYLLVFETSSSWVFPLPLSGDVVIGRGEAANLRLADTSISRSHARITVTPGEVRLSDLNSQNGTFLNGDRLVGTRPLVSGDTIGLSTVTLVFNAGTRRQATRSLASFSQFRQRVEEEVERSQRSRRPWTIAAVHLGVGIADRGRVAAALSGQIRRIDLATWDGADQLLLLLTETAGDKALAATARLLMSLGKTAPAAKAGLAGWPMDGLEVDTLLAKARAAAIAAESTKLAQAAQNYRTIRFGERVAVVADPAMVRLFSLLKRLAAADMPVLILGETGSGKDLVASAIHSLSPRRDKPFVVLNCAAIPEQLVESELFGFERGAFSGAVAAKSGVLETAEGGTLFLDEISDLPPPAQAKLLRVLETKRLRPLGEIHERELDIRLVAATNRDLEEEVAQGRFRRDLYFRLKGATVWIPPLRNRKGEIPILAQYFLAKACARVGRDPMVIAAGAMESLMLHSWPGNVRELQSLIDYVVAVAKGPVLEAWHLADWLEGSSSLERPAEADALADDADEPTEAGKTQTLPGFEEGEGSLGFRPLNEEIRELERSRMITALEAAGGSKRKAALLLGMPPRTFLDKLKAFGVQVDSKPTKSKKTQPPT